MILARRAVQRRVEANVTKSMNGTNFLDFFVA